MEYKVNDDIDRVRRSDKTRITRKERHYYKRKQRTNILYLIGFVILVSILSALIGYLSAWLYIGEII